jgi:hypothetical protein
MDSITQESSPDLGELLFNEGESGIDTKAEDFRITSIDMAAWAARKVVAARERMAARTALSSQYKARIDRWLERANAEDRESAEFLTGHLRPFAESEIAKQRRSRTLQLPGATVSLRKKPDRVEILDESVLIAYCEENYPEALVVSKSVSKAAITARVRSGELPPAVDFIPGEDELYIKSDGEDTPRENHADAAA